jgi:uncharacterized paraquat-inducible protein A
VGSLIAAIRKRIRREQRKVEREPLWCMKCELPLTQADLEARYCTNCYYPVHFQTKAALRKAIDAILKA